MGIISTNEDNKFIMIYAGSSKTPDRIVASKLEGWTKSFKMVIRRYVGIEKKQ